MANKTIEELKSEAAVVRDATEEGENTATRVGTVLIDMIDSLSNATVNGIKGYMVIDSTSELPTNPTSDQQMIGYLLDTTLYVWVGTGGDTLDGKYQSAELQGPAGATGPAGADGHDGVSLGEVALVNNLTEGGEESALTAEMGKRLNVLAQKEVKDVVVADDFVNTGFMRPNGTLSTGGSYRYTNKINIKGCTFLYVHDTTKNSSVSPAVFFDANDSYISGYTWSSGEDQTIPVPSNAVSVVCSVHYLKTDVWSCDALRYLRYMGSLTKNEVCYLSNSGNDTNDGLTASTPVATLDRVKELLDPNGTLYILEGDYEFNYDLSLFSFVQGVGKVRIIRLGQKITSASLVSGYTRVYSVAYTGEKSSQGKLYAKHLWQHDIPDADTLIPTSEMHPLQFGKTYRLTSTRIYPAESIAEIESTTTKPMWFYDNGTQTLYFSIVNGSSLATNPVMVPKHNYTTHASKTKEVKIENIHFMYHAVETQNLTGVFKQCSFGFTSNAGALVLNYTRLLRLVNCEAYGGDIDGFNTAHSSTTNLAMSTILFENCWGHDCADDGESCHEHSLVIHHGGLFEYNGNGVTPASGGCGEYHDVIVRNCGDNAWSMGQGGTGFSAQFGSGTHSSVVCYGCYALNNKVGFSASSADGSSFAVSCVAKGNSITAFRNVTQLNSAEQT